MKSRPYAIGSLYVPKRVKWPRGRKSRAQIRAAAYHQMLRQRRRDALNALAAGRQRRLEREGLAE